MTRDVPASETRVNMPVARPRDMRFATVAKGKGEDLKPSQQTGFQQPEFWIIMVEFWIPLAGFRIPKPWIPDSTDQNYLDSGFRITLHGATTVKCNT